MTKTYGVLFQPSLTEAPTRRYVRAERKQPVMDLIYQHHPAAKIISVYTITDIEDSDSESAREER